MRAKSNTEQNKRGDLEGEKEQAARATASRATPMSCPFSRSSHLLMQPASDVHRQVGVPSERIASLPEGVHFAYCPGGLLRREGDK